MICVGCGTQNKSLANFCTGCGSPLARPAGACPSCRVQSSPGARFCRACGTHLDVVATDPVAAPPAGRRPNLGERFATLVVDPRTTRRALAVTGVLAALTIVLIGLQANSRFPLVVVLALLPLFLWIPLALWIDRHEPEPRWLLFVAFLWGASISILVAGTLNSFSGETVGWVLGDDAGDFYSSSVSAPISEELMKGAVLAFIFWRRRHAITGALDAFVYATMVGLGFAMTENVLYYARAESVGDVFVTYLGRGVATPLLHPLFTSMTALGLVIALQSKRRRIQIGAPLVGLALAMLLHSLWNTNAGGHFGFGGIIVTPIFFLTLLGCIVVVIVLSVRREAQIIRTYIPDEIAPRDEVDRLFSLRARIADAWTAFRVGGWRAVRARDDYVRALSAAAFRNYREARAADAAKDSPDSVTAGYRNSLRELISWNVLLDSVPSTPTQAEPAPVTPVAVATEPREA
jgi:protease PrsW